MSINQIVILGSTATGKSSLGIQLAKDLNGEIVSLDAYQIYKGVDIASAKVKDFGGVAHHLIDIVDIGYAMSVKEFQSRAREAIADIQARNRLPILVGGSALYIQAVLFDFEFQATDRDVRSKLQDLSDEIGSKALYQKLVDIDPEAAAHIAQGDTRRVIRALEVNQITGSNYTPQLTDIEPAINHQKIGLSISPSTLRKRVIARVEQMFAEGLKDEVQRLHDQGFFQTPTAAKAIGYEDAWRLVQGEINQVDAIASIANKTMTYAKKQMKWFKRDSSITWFDVEEVDFVTQVLSYVKSSLRTQEI
jgi:tRNA dimethylallyltransferase